MAAPSPSSTTTRIWSSRVPRGLFERAAQLFDHHAPLILLLASTYLAFFLLSGWVAVTWAREDASPSVRVLDSGGRHSLLVTSGEARLLIATGSDASTFSNALSSALHPTNRRIDIAILAGGERDVSIAAHAADAFMSSEIFVLPGPLASMIADLDLSPDQVIAKEMTFSLPGKVTVTVRPGNNDDGGWSAVISKGGLTIAAASSANELDFTSRPEVVILPDVNEGDRLRDSAAIVVSGVKVDWSDLEAVGGETSLLWAVRTFPGESASLTFADDGIRLPSSARALDPN